MWRIRVVRGAATPNSARVTDGLTLGRASEADVVCRDPLVSRLHARLAVLSDGVWVTDLGSANGTEVDGVRSERRRLPPGTRLRLGDTELVLEPDDGTQQVEVEEPVRRRPLGGHTTIRIRASLDTAPAPSAASAPIAPDLAEQFASTDDTLSRFHRFARGAARYAEADVALVLVRVAPGGPHVVAGRSPDSPEGGPSPVPRAPLARASRQGQALLLSAESANPGGRSEGGDGPGRVHVRGSAMCAPIGPPGAGDAILYAERRDAARAFTAAELGPFAALAAQAAPSLAQELAWFRWRVAEGLLASPDGDPVLVGESPAFLGMLDVAEHVAAARAPILVHGEPGSGRRLLARLIHARSRGQRRPFLVVSAASLPQGDEASALFGESSGGRRRPGLVEDVGFGTLCIAEVADLAPAAQPLLADAVTSIRYAAVGSEERRMLRCRIVATTSQNLAQLAAAGEFHAPLAAALSGVTVGVPGLAERTGDVSLLTEHFAAAHGRKLRGVPYVTTERARAALHLRSYPGHIAQLSNLIERAVLASQRPEIDLDEIDGPASRDGSGEAPPDLSLEAAERAAIVRALAASRGRKGRAAELLGISWPTLTRKVREYGIAEP